MTSLTAMTAGDNRTSGMCGRDWHKFWDREEQDDDEGI